MIKSLKELNMSDEEKAWKAQGILELTTEQEKEIILSGSWKNDKNMSEDDKGYYERMSNLYSFFNLK